MASRLCINAHQVITGAELSQITCTDLAQRQKRLPYSSMCHQNAKLTLACFFPSFIAIEADRLIRKLLNRRSGLEVA